MGNEVVAGSKSSFEGWAYDTGRTRCPTTRGAERLHPSMRLFVSLSRGRMHEPKLRIR